MNRLLALYQFAEDTQITVDCYGLKKREALSLMDTDGSCYIAIDPERITGTADLNVKLAHEIGHCATGSFYNQYATCDVRQKHEHRADKWAIENLISKEDLEEAVRSGYTEVWDLAEYFNVTEDFMRKVICWYQNGNLNVENL